MQSYYQGISYRHGTGFANLSTADSAPRRDSDSPCLDSSQAHFCRDLWINAAREGVREVESLRSSPGIGVRAAQPGHGVQERSLEKRAEEGHAQRQRPAVKDADANAGSDFDAMPDSDGEPEPADTYSGSLSIPNSVFRPARILVNPRCVTTYAGVSHVQLALDLFGPEDDDAEPGSLKTKYILDDWEGAPDSFVCQEQK